METPSEILGPEPGEDEREPDTEEGEGSGTEEEVVTEEEARGVAGGAADFGLGLDPARVNALALELRTEPATAASDPERAFVAGMLRNMGRL